MCGRFEVNHKNREIDRLLKSLPPGSPEIKIGEVFPTNPALTLTLQNETIEPSIMAWGFPRWDGKGVIFNARSESALEKPMFRHSLMARPVAIPTTGFYEWRSVPGKKHKEKYIFRSSNPVLYLAGFWNSFPDDPAPQHFTILTTKANPAMQPYHNRMPIILEERELKSWLNGQRLTEILMREPVSLEATLLA